MKKLICFLSIFTFIGCLCGISFAAEHPGTDIFEHPGEKTVLGGSEIIAAIEKHIDSVTRANNGIFPLHDAEEGKDIALKLVRVHKGKVSYIKKEDAYFACTDFITADQLQSQNKFPGLCFLPGPLGPSRSNHHY